MLRALLLLSLFSSIWMGKYAQAQILDDLPLEVFESIVEDQEDPFDYDQLLEEWKSFVQNPINLNKASAEELAELPFADPNLCFAIVRHRLRYGDFRSIYELQAIPTMDYENFLIFKNLATVKGEGIRQLQREHFFSRGQYQISLRYQRVLEEVEGQVAEDSMGKAYEGSADKIYFRAQYKFDRLLSYGIIGEKDAGETFFRGSNQQGFDFYSVHVFLRDQKWAKALAIGDYGVNMGQGLLTWSGFGLGKSSEVIRIKKTGENIRPYSSTNEVNFFRGAAYESNFDKINFTLFASTKRRDANKIVTDTADNFFDNVSSLQTSGLHRTDAELEDEGSIRENHLGSQLQYAGRKLKLGLNSVFTKWDKDIQKGGSLYQQFDFQGNRLFGASFDFSYQMNNAQFFGELASSDFQAKAFVLGVMSSIDPKLDVSILYRNYDKAYNSFNARGFGEASKPRNEKGVYAGFHFQPSYRWALRMYADWFEHPWLRFRVDAPSKGQEYFAQLDYRPLRRSMIYFRWKRETKLRNPSLEQTIDKPVEILKQQFRIDLKHNINKQLVLNSRIGLSFFDEEGKRHRGSLVYQNVSYKPLGKAYSFAGRVAFFDVEDFDARLYAYEQDLPYTFSIPAFNNRGMRYYLNLRYNFHPSISFWARVSQTRYSNLDEISSGNERIEGNKKTEIKLMLRYKIRPRVGI